MTSTYNPKFKHVPRSELKVGETYVCGDEEHEASICWRYKDEVVPLKITARNYLYSRVTLEGLVPDNDICGCEDLDHLYLYEPMETNNEITWADLKKGIYVANRNGFQRCIEARIEDVVCLPSISSFDAYTSEMTWYEIAELKLKGWSIVQPTKKLSREQVLASLTPEQRAALGE
jgi:hypothetical protein